MNNSLHARFLHAFLLETASSAPYLYGLLRSFPREHFFVFRWFNNRTSTEGYLDRDRNTFTLSEFMSRIEEFDPDDLFTLYFVVRTDRIDSARQGDYTDRISIDCRRAATVANLKRHVRMFLESYCETCLRANHPFEITPELIAHCGFTPDDAERARKLVEPFNHAAQRMLRKEYAALAKLDFICPKRR